MAKYTITQIAKSLEKVFNAGFNTEQTIKALQLEDLKKMKEVSMQDIDIIIDFKKAVRTRKLLQFIIGEEI